MDYGIQLYSVRDLAKQSLEQAVEQVAALGYSYVEFAGFFDRTADEINAMLKKSGISLSGTHSPFDDLVNDFENTVAFHKAIGNRLYIIPGYSLSSQKKLDFFVKNAGEISKKLEREGITLAFHNHAKEFIPNADGSVAFEQILYRTDIKLEVDTYWAYVGMKDPLVLLERARDRVVALHIKDGFEDGQGMPLGRGSAPLAEILQAARELDVPLVVESETCNPSGIEEAKICIDYLKNI